MERRRTVAQPASIVVRRERPGDEAAIADVHRAAFAPSTGEITLVELLRAGAGWIPALSLVAEVGGRIAGHVVTSRGWLVTAGAERPALGLGPLGVLPGLHGGGVGSALVQATIGAASALDEEVICLLGDPRYYGRFGFVLASTVGIEPPVAGWRPHFQARLLSAGSDLGPATFRYDPAFDAV